MTYENIEDTITKLNNVLALHTKMKGAYYMNPPATPELREAFAEEHSLYTEFQYEDSEESYCVKIIQRTYCTSTLISYKADYYINGKQICKNICFVKKMLENLQSRKDSACTRNQMIWRAIKFLASQLE